MSFPLSLRTKIEQLVKWDVRAHVTNAGADAEPVDPKNELEDRCKAPCTRPLKEYQECAKRIQGDESGHKHCTGQYFDYWHCVDKCVATKLFSHLK